MTNGQAVVKAALAELGAAESPWGSNTGPRVDLFTGLYGMHAVPWCGCYAGYAYRQAGIDDSGVCSPSTAVTCLRADAKGGLAPERGKPIPPGSLWVNCSVHIEVVRQDNGDGTVSNIGGNVNQQVSLTRRRITDGRIIVPPAILEGEPEPVKVYGFDDLELRPHRFGGWPTKAQREKVIAKLPDDARKRVRRIRATGAASPFAFELVAPARWRFGPWGDAASRDRLAKEYGRAHPGHKLRPWSLEAAPTPDAAGLTSGDTQI